jgi:hypothetical protein
MNSRFLKSIANEITNLPRIELQTNEKEEGSGIMLVLSSKAACAHQQQQKNARWSRCTLRVTTFCFSKSLSFAPQPRLSNPRDYVMNANVCSKRSALALLQCFPPPTHHPPVF